MTPAPSRRLRVGLVTNFCQYYRVPLFERLAELYDLELFFFSPGDETYWLAEHGTAEGRFVHHDLPGRRLLGTTINPSLVPTLWRGGFDVFVSGVVGKFAMPATFAVARAQGRPFLLWTQIWMRLQTPIHRAIFPATRFVYRHADAIVASGEHVRQYLLREGVAADRVFDCAEATDNRLYNRPVSAARKLEIRARLGIEGDRKILLFLGRLEREKGLLYLIEAFAAARLEDCVLVLAGRGDAGYERQLRSRVEQLGIGPKVRFPGFVPNPDTPDYYATAWGYILPSITTPAFKEPWGLVINEAFNQGLPAIVTDCVGAAAAGMLRHEHEGLIVPERNVPALAQALRRLVGEPGLRNRLGLQARATIDEWDIERVAGGFRRAIAHVSSGVRKNGFP